MGLDALEATAVEALDAGGAAARVGCAGRDRLAAQRRRRGAARRAGSCRPLPSPHHDLRPKRRLDWCDRAAPAQERPTRPSGRACDRRRADRDRSRHAVRDAGPALTRARVRRDGRLRNRPRPPRRRPRRRARGSDDRGPRRPGEAARGGSVAAAVDAADAVVFGLATRDPETADAGVRGLAAGVAATLAGVWAARRLS